MRDVAEGDRVRSLRDGRVGVVRRMAFDNSCNDPDCCAGPYPDVAYVYFSDAPDDWEDFSDDGDGDFEDLEAHP